MAVSFLLLCLTAPFIPGPGPVEAARTVHRQHGSGAQLGTELRSAGTTCNDMVATVKFPSIEVEFSILKKGTRGEEHTVQCGPTAANPDEEVTFNCTDFEGGKLAWSYKSGTCRSEEVAPGSPVTCPRVKFDATWTVAGQDVPLHFVVPETANPEGEDLLVELKCPAGTPGAGKAFDFMCTKSGKWDFDNGKKTFICASDGEDLQQEAPSEGPKEVHEVIAGALPCALDTEDTPLKGGGMGFTLLAKCEKPISDGVIKVDGKVGWNFELGDHTIVNRILTLSDQYYGKELAIEAKCDGVLGSVSIKPKPLADLEPLPCELSSGSTRLSSGVAGFQVLIKCKKPVTKGVLVLPGFQDKTLPDPINGFQVLYTQKLSLFKGKTLTVKGFSDGSKGALKVTI